MADAISQLTFGEMSHQSVGELLKGTTLSDASPLAGQIVDILRDLIVSLKIFPGQSLSEKEVATSLKASKTPVREAMIRLEVANLVKIVPHSGTYVAPLNIDRYKAACFTRLNLEIGAVRTAALSDHRQNFHAEFLELIEQQQSALEADHFESFFHLDEAFHRLLFDMADVPAVWSIIKRTQVDVYRVRHLRRLQKINNGPKVVADHKRIIAAIMAGDPDAAQHALIQHIGRIEDKIKAISDQPELMKFIEKLNTSRSRRSSSRAAKTERVSEEVCQA